MSHCVHKFWCMFFWHFCTDEHQMWTAIVLPGNHPPCTHLDWIWYVKKYDSTHTCLSFWTSPTYPQSLSQSLNSIHWTILKIGFIPQFLPRKRIISLLSFCNLHYLLLTSCIYAKVVIARFNANSVERYARICLQDFIAAIDKRYVKLSPLMMGTLF